MLQPTSSDPAPAPETGDARVQRARPEALVVTLDPSWRAGRKLAEARRQLGLSLEEVAERIRVRREFLEALETMNVKLLPGKAYALAFLRSYARALGVEERAIVDQFQDECALTREDTKAQIRNPSSRPHPERPWLAAAILVLLAAGFVGWRAVQQGEPRSTGQETARTAPETSVQGALRGALADGRVVEIRALQPAWLEARGPDGTVFFSRELAPGEVYRPDASPGWTLHARDGGAFELFVDGAAAGSLGPAGSPVLGRPIDRIEPIVQANTAFPRS